MDKITLGTRKVSIEFPGVKALSDVDFEISTGMIHAVMGANGAGKSTLMKVLAGSNPDYTGDVLYNGNVVELRNPAAAKKLGIQIVYQEVDMALIPTLSVAENVMFNDMVMNMGHKQFVNYGKIRKDAKEALARLNIDIDVKRWCGTLTLAQKQMVLIARAVQNSCNFLILDEPTNDLDIPTLTILEDYLDTFPGIVITVSHDRYFLDRVVNRIFAFEGDGRVQQYEGGYTDYQNACLKRAEAEGGQPGGGQEGKTEVRTNGKTQRTRGPQKLKFSYKEQRDYETIEGEMADLEERISSLEQEIQASAHDFVKLNQLMAEKEEAEAALEEKMERWMYLEELAAKIAEQ